MAAATIHEWLFALIEETCHDREYLYRAYVEHFCGLLAGIYRAGSTAERGTYHLPGIKSDRQASLFWTLEHRLDFQGPNVLAVTCRIFDAGSPSQTTEQRTARFDLSTGKALPG
jgi:hypothetical protein